MFRFAVIVCAGLLAWKAPAQTGLPEAFRSEVARARVIGSRTSASRQFITHDATQFYAFPLTLNRGIETNYVRLDASLLAISCENIKSALLRELQAPDRWQGSVSLFLHQARSANEPVVIAPTVNGTAWSYYIALPDTIERSRLVSAVVGVLLLEIANRGSDHPAEVPAWLTQGLTCQLMTKNPTSLVIDKPSHSENNIPVRWILFDDHKADPLKIAHEVLSDRPPLTLDELSWPEPGFEETDAYRGSAQLFVHQLLQLPNGPACLRAMLQELPRHYNWQLSFLDAFGGHFKDELEAEKWWSLTVVGFTGRNLLRVWPADESWHQLDDILRTGAEVRASTNELPLHTEITLQEIIRNWDWSLQAGTLKNKITQLGLIRAWVAPDYVLLTDDYRLVLQNYVKKREEKPGFFHRSKHKEPTGMDPAALDAIAQLDDLDARLAQSRPPSSQPRQVTASLSADR